MEWFCWLQWNHSVGYNVHVCSLQEHVCDSEMVHLSVSGQCESIVLYPYSNDDRYYIHVRTLLL